MKTSVITAFILAALTTVRIADVSGKWQAEFDTRSGRQKYLYTFLVERDKISGIAESEIQGEKRKAELKEIKLTTYLACGFRRPHLAGLEKRLVSCRAATVSLRGKNALAMLTPVGRASRYRVTE